MRVDELEKENEALKNKIKRYEEFIKTHQGGEIENNLKELRDSMTNKDRFSTAIEKLKKRIINESWTQDRERIPKEKWKE